MPPKSSTKKEQALWFFCEKCKVTVSSKDIQNHEEFCPITETSCSCCFIKEKKLYTNLFEPKPLTDDIKTLTQKQLNGIIFISEKAIKLCELIIGDFVLVKIPQKPDFVPVVRMVWPIVDRFQTTVFVSNEEYESTWRSYKDNQIVISRLPSNPLPSDEILLTSKTELDKKIHSDLTLVLRKHLRDNIYTPKNKISINFFNKKFEFIVKSIKPRSEIDNLELKLSSLSLETKVNFFSINQNTRIEIESTKIEAVGSTPTINKIEQIGGLDSVLTEIRETMNLALGKSNLIPNLKISRGILLHGPSGCGKSLVSEAIAFESEALLININASEIFSKFFGETESNLVSHFNKAFNNYPKPTIILIEELKNLCPKNDNVDAVKRVSSSFMTLLDSLHIRNDGSKIFVIGTTSNPDNLNPSVRRSGRLDYEIEIPVPNPRGREEILQKLFKKTKNNLNETEIKEVATVTHGFVGADLASLVTKATIHSLKSDTIVKIADINYALTQIKPSAMREVLIESPNILWTDIGGQHDLKLKLKQAIEWPITHPETFERLGIRPPRGVLMFGPPGCSKTMIAKALATESKVNFLSIKGPELFSMWVGESERAVRELFRKARQVAPSIIFFDEIDAIGGERSSEGGGSSVKERVLAQLLTEMDGVNSLNNVTIVAATNRPDLIDKALMRPGRIDRIVYVKLPDAETRSEIFKIKLKKMPIADDVNIEKLVEQTEGYSGAEIQAVCHEAALNALEISLDATIVNWSNFQVACKAIQPRTTSDLLNLYDEYLKQF